MVALFQARDERLAQTHYNVNTTGRYYVEWKRSYFFPVEAYSIISLEFNYRPELDILSYHRLYLLSNTIYLKSLSNTMAYAAWSAKLTY